MSKTSSFRRPFEKPHGKRAQARFKSVSHRLYQIHRSLSRQLSWKKTLLLTCQILGLLVSTLAANEKYPVLNRDNSKIPIQMQLSHKQKFFSAFSAALLKFSWNYERFQKNRTLPAFLFPKLRSLKRWSDKSLKSPVSEDPSTSNMVNVPKHYSSLHHITFILFNGLYQVNRAGKSPSYWHEKSWDCLITHWVPMKIILFLIERI